MKNKNRIFGFIVLLSVIGVSLALIACDSDGGSSDYIAYDISGKWRTNDSNWYQIDVNNKRFILSDSHENSLTVEDLIWKEVLNDGTILIAPASEYPRGFELTGKITKNKNMYGSEFSTGQTGVTVSRTIYIHNDKNKTVYSGRKTDIFYKR